MSLEPPQPPPAGDPEARVATPPWGDGEPGFDEEAFRPRRPASPPADGMAVTAFVLALIGVPVVGIVLGHLSLRRIRSRGIGGRGLARAALVLGYLGLVLGLAWWVLYFALLAPLVTLPG